MRSIVVMLVMLAALLVGGWVGGETLLARSATRIIASDPRADAAGVTEMREAQRIGVRVQAPRFVDPGLTATGDWLDLWVRTTAPNELHAALAPATTLTSGGRTLTLGPEGAQGYLRFSPSRGTALSEAELVALNLNLDGATAVGGVTLRAELTGLGADSPAGAGVAYNVNGALDQVMLPTLTGGAVPGVLGISGLGRVWLSAVPVKALDVADGRIEAARPRLVGLRADGVDVTLDDLSARVFARLIPDANGQAVGEVLIDTADLSGFVQRAADLGVIQPGQVTMVNTAIEALAKTAPTPVADRADPNPPGAYAGAAANRALVRTVTDLPAHARVPGAAWPAPAAGHSRLLLTFGDGQITLGGFAIGPSPRIAPHNG